LEQATRRRHKRFSSGHSILLIFLVYGVVLASSRGWSSAQTNTMATDEQDKVEELSEEMLPNSDDVKPPGDSLVVYPPKMSSRLTWEEIVSLPGTLVYFPVRMVFKTAEKTAIYLDDAKVVRRIVDVMTSDDGLRGLRPYYSSRAGIGMKVFQKGLFTEDSKLTLTLAAGLRGRRRYELRLKRVQFPGNAFTSEYRIRYQFLSDESFYGIGPDTKKLDRSNFAHEQVILLASFRRFLKEGWSVNALIGFQQNEIKKGRDRRYPSTTDLYTGEQLSGLSTSNGMAQFGLELQGQSSNKPGQPHGGFGFSLASTIAQQVDDDSFGFWKVNADISKYVHLFYNRAIVLRAAGEVTEPLSGRGVPFYHFSELGRGDTIRGFRRGRFRDLDMILGSIEYRYPVWYHTDIALFVDAGQVSRDIFNRISMGSFEVGYGLGIRLSGAEEMGTLISKLEIAKSREEIRFYFLLNPDL
jgi:hypothetical protein